ncbi:hypothetical protein N7519_006428 [Penicillium mononematosum]|uniref:uncharacterized protein n=1 Tax=Penicillium mononematosum TaxID=268346 RepID=UPI002548AEE1|nr:uncharacterized protein N7519_006428 [Penicillium mononematosum]KAJ6185127.1 hypothetical protein N7519_006428 [Penicillium mononematosum]
MVLAAPAIELNNDAPPSSGCYPLQQVTFISSTVQQAAVTLPGSMLEIRWGHFLDITAGNKQ